MKKIEAVSLKQSNCKIIPVFPEELFTMPRLQEYGKGNQGICFESYSVKVPACNLYIIPQGKIILGREEVFTKDNQVIQEITSQAINPYIGQSTNQLVTSKFLNGRILHLSLSGLEDNYYHFTVEFIARWYIWLSSGIYFDWVTFPLKHPFHIECANLLGINSSKILNNEDYHCIQADEILVPDLVNNWKLVFYRNTPHFLKLFLPSWIAKCYKEVLKKSQEITSFEEQEKIFPSKVYISRAKAKYRKIANEDVLIGILKKYEISIVYLEDLSLSQQINLFANLEVIISPHGAGLVNISYCKKRVKILELYSSEYHDSSFRIHSEILGHYYNYIVGNKIKNSHASPKYEDIAYENFDRVEKWLSENTPAQKSTSTILHNLKEFNQSCQPIIKTPVVFLIFNRPETTQQVFDTIRQAQPQTLLVVADGPRNDRPEDVDNCRATRAILEQVDWDCEVLTNYSDVNLGCRKRISSGLTWAFEQVEEAIILEDDCLPDPSFFQYCQELLDYYRQDDRIMMISGDNFQFGNNPVEHSYYFSRYSHIWGWATWRRAWQCYDENLLSWPKLHSENWLKNYLKDDRAALFWTRIFDVAYQGYDSWDYGWLFTVWKNDGLSITPATNLVANIGFGSGTHTLKQNNPLSNLPIGNINFPLIHPSCKSRHKVADNFTESSQFSGQHNLEDLKLVEALVRSFSCRSFDTTTICKICESESHHFFNTKILGKYQVRYFQCRNCDFVQTETPYWLEEAYGDPITASDVGYVTRNNALADLSEKLITQFFDDPSSKFLDYGGGYGLFVRLMRDRGFDFYWHDKFCRNLFAQEFELNPEQAENITLITAFEVFEHLESPLETLERLLKISPNILINTELLPSHNPIAHEWWYYAPHEGQHIGIYTQKSLKFIADKYSLRLYTDGESTHLLTTQENLPQDLFQQLRSYSNTSSFKESLLGSDIKIISQKVQLKYASREEKLIKSRLNQEKTYQSLKKPLIVIDTVFFQLYQTGIARVWRSLLEYWSHTDFAQHLLILDRLRTAPRFPGLRYLDIPGFSYDNIENDRQMLQQICEANQADLFISSYYTIPIDTPSVMMVYDMIPEVMEANLDQPMWRSKHDAIDHASHFLSISENTALDLIRYRPDLDSQNITIAHCGVSPHFKPASGDIVAQFKFKYGIQKPYFVIIGCPKTSYKNTRLFYEGLSQLSSRFGFEIISIGAYLKVDSDFRELAAGITIHTLNLSDEELTIAYSGAIALVYPSQYEGFGLPIVEAMACGCPVITCPNSSIPEVAGDAAIYILDEDVDGMAEALCEVQKPAIREAMISMGLEQSKKFSWEKMATIVQEKLLIFTLLPARLSHWNLLYSINFDRPDDELQAVFVELLKTSLEFYHQHISLSRINHQPDPNEETILDNDWGLTVFVQADPPENQPEDFDLLLSSASFELLTSTDLEMTDRLQIYLLPSLSHQQQTILESHLSGPKNSL